MAVTVSEIKALRIKRKELAEQANQLLGQTDQGDAEASAKFDRIHADIEALRVEIDAKEQELDAQFSASEAAHEFRARKSHQERVERELGAADPATLRARKWLDSIAAQAAPEDEEAAAAVEVYGEAFSAFLRDGYAALSHEHQNALRGAKVDRDAFKGTSMYAAVSSGNDASLGFLIPPAELQPLTDAIKAFGGMFQAPTYKFTTTSGNEIPFPTSNDTANEGSYRGENVAHPSATDPAVGMKKLGAHTCTSGIILAPIEFMQDESFGFEAWLFRQLGTRIGRRANRALTTGTGAGQPTGIVGGSAEGVQAASASAVTFQELLTLKHNVNSGYRTQPGVGWMFADSTLLALKKITDATGRPIFQSGVALREPDTIDGNPFWINDDIAAIGSNAKSILFGAFPYYAIRQVAARGIVRLVERYADQGQVGFIAYERHDGILLNPDPAGTLNPVKHLVNAA